MSQNPSAILERREIRHFHLFCGLGGGALGFKRPSWTRTARAMATGRPGSARQAASTAVARWPWRCGTPSPFGVRWRR